MTAASDGPVGRRFDTVLVANRGEIARRVLRTARSEGYRTVAVFSDADRDAPHVAEADVAVRLGPAPARESYLDVAAVLAACRRSGAGAVHPGYGFLSENADFAQAVLDAGLVWVGPPPQAIREMGDKAGAKRRMQAAGVPLVPGYAGEEQSDERLREEAGRVGYPLMVKASAGGGGKGMRVVERPEQLADAIAGARREAAAAFGDDTLLLERALLAARHVEVQVLADEHGGVVPLAERDCSTQRRHQKVVEEAPAPGLSTQVRQTLARSAVDACRAVDYVGAGTLEYLVDADGTVAFLEMNTRLQVEHPVTEEVLGVDLVAAQLAVAQGDRLHDLELPDAWRPLDPRREDVDDDDLQEFTWEHLAEVADGHGSAVEVRLYAEDPDAGYLPQTGVVEAWRPDGDEVPPPGSAMLAASATVRVDGGVRPGSVVGADYDPMLAKVVAVAESRERALDLLTRALERTVCLGVRTNRAWLVRVLRHPVLREGRMTTTWLAEHAEDLAPEAPSPEQLAAVSGWLHLQREADAERRSPGLGGWTNAATQRSRQRLRVDAGGGPSAVRTHDVVVRRERDRLTVAVGPADVEDGASPGGGAGSRAAGEPTDASTFVVERVADRVAVDGLVVDLDAVRLPAPGLEAADRVLVRLPGHDLDVVDVLHAPPADAAEVAGEGVLVAPMHGSVVAAPAAQGQEVAVGDPVVVVEAMKMEHTLTADVAGTVLEVAAVGAQVASGDVVARLQP